jgi:DNA-nicking Smr family endonuclease
MAKQRRTDPGADPEFRAAVRDVKPLAQTALAPGLEKAKPRVRKRAAASTAIEDLAALPVGDPVTGGETLSFHRPGVGPQVLRRLRRGLFPVDDELDLHGFNETAARQQLAEFLAQSREARHRCVRIIHGKGYRSGARGPVLKTAVNFWLRRHLDVIAFVSARTIDGGTGAVYVLLRA